MLFSALAVLGHCLHYDTQISHNLNSTLRGFFCFVCYTSDMLISFSCMCMECLRRVIPAPHSTWRHLCGPISLDCWIHIQMCSQMYRIYSLLRMSPCPNTALTQEINHILSGNPCNILLKQSLIDTSNIVTSLEHRFHSIEPFNEQTEIKKAISSYLTTLFGKGLI